MALLDVKKYYSKQLSLYLQAKDDLIDFEQALKDGYITEDKLFAVKEDVAKLKENLDRLSFIMYLFEQPKTKTKKYKYLNNESNKLLLKYFVKNKATANDVEAESLEVLSRLKQELKTLRENNE